MLLTVVPRKGLKRRSGVAMARLSISSNHRWVLRQVQIDGRSFFHRQFVGEISPEPRKREHGAPSTSAFSALIFWMMRPPNVGCPKTVPDAPAWRTKQRARAARSRGACQFQNVESVVKEKPDLESGPFGAKPMTVEVAEHLKFVDERPHQFAQRIQPAPPQRSL